MLHSTQQILDARGPRNPVDPALPYHFLVEQEYSAGGMVEDVATVFLTNRECPFQCLMCDLWKNTTETTVPVGAIPAQIDWALAQLPNANHIKLYNSGNFFDPHAVPAQDLPEIARRVSSFRTVIVENHPRLCSDRCAVFQQMCGTQLEVALGLETSHPATLATLNKQMTTDDFARACEMLLGFGIRVRAFVLLRPPGVSEEQGIEQAVESVRFAFKCGVDCCAVIPTRPGNGILDRLYQEGLIYPPSLSSLEAVMEQTIEWRRGRVFADLWDVDRFSACDQCLEARRDRLQRMNLTQKIPAAIRCSCSENPLLSTP